MFDLIDMPWDWPVEVNYLEAKAFCKWKGPGYRLPIEAEHHVMRGVQVRVNYVICTFESLTLSNLLHIFKVIFFYHNNI